MALVDAIQRFLRRCVPVCLGLALAFFLMTLIQVAFSVIVGRLGWLGALKAAAVSPFVGIAFGIVIAAIARSEQRNYAKKLRFDVYGLAGGLCGFFVGGFLGLIDRDNEFRWIGIENNALVIGCIAGLFAGAIPMAIVGELVSPSNKSDRQAPPKSPVNENA